MALSDVRDSLRKRSVAGKLTNLGKTDFADA